MIPKTTVHYDWFDDIQPALAKYMNIDENYFRDYHLVVGGTYKDFWHVMLDIIELRGNDSFEYLFWEPDDEEGKEKLREKFGSWIDPLLIALNQLKRDYDQDDKGILIWFSW